MNILHVIPNFYPARGYGGGPLVAYEMCLRLSRMGHNVRVLTTDVDTLDSRLEGGVRYHDGVETHYFRNLSNELAYRYKLFLPVSMLSMVESQLEGVDLVHIHDYRTLPNLVVSGLARRMGIPYVIQFHGTLNRAQRRFPKRVFDYLVGSSMIKKASGLLALNSTEATALRSMTSPRIPVYIVPNGINGLNHDHDNPGNKPGNPGSNPSNNLGNPGNGSGNPGKTNTGGNGGGGPLILYLGRIHPSKGLDLLVRAFALVRGYLPSARLVMAGPDDGDLERIGHLAGELGVLKSTRFVGYVSEEEKIGLLERAAVFVVPIFYGFPLTFLEAWRLGVPVVTTDLGDSVTGPDGDLGLVTKGSAEEVAVGIRRLLLDEGLRRRVSNRSVSMVSRWYDWDMITGKVDTFYRRVLDRTIGPS